MIAGPGSQEADELVHRDLPDLVEKRASEGAAFKGAPESGGRAPLAIAVLAVVVLAVAFLTKQPVAAPVVVTATVAPQQAPAPASGSSAPTVVNTVSRTVQAPDLNPTATKHPTYAAVAVDPGPIQLVPAGLTQARLTMTVPEGWRKSGDAMYSKPNAESPVDLSIGAWSLLHVETFPCRWSSDVYADASLMRTAEGQAEALSAWWGQDPGQLPYWNSEIAPLATKPQPTTFHDFPAWSLQVLIPRGFDLAKCDAGQLILWETSTGDVRFSLPGELHRLWLVDAHGELITIDAAASSGTTSADEAEIQSIVDSLVIEP